MSAADRRAARVSWSARVFRNGWEEMASYDALFWDAIPVDERASAVWQQSLEMYAVAEPGAHERRLPRSSLRIERR
jgi:hypothetical protein